MRLFLLPAFILIVSTFTGYAVEPETKKISVNIETGLFGSLDNSLDARWQIRKSAWSHYDYGYSNYGAPYDNFQVSYFGVKPEYLFANDKLSVSAGLRFLDVFSSISSGSLTDNNAFYLLYNQSDNVTEYARVKEINQESYYLSVPIELTYIPWRFRYLSLYAKVGTEFGYLLNSTSDIVFMNSTMNVEKQSILNNTGVSPNSRYSTFYSALGVKFGKPNKVRYNVEIYLPSKLLSENNSSILKMGALTGFSLSVSIPVK